MKIQPTEFSLTITRAEAEVVTDAMDMACDAQDTQDADCRAIVQDIRGAQRSMKAKLQDGVEVIVERIGAEAMRQVAIGLELLAEWVEEDEQPTALDEAQQDALVAIVDAIRASGILKTLITTSIPAGGAR